MAQNPPCAMGCQQPCTQVQTVGPGAPHLQAEPWGCKASRRQRRRAASRGESGSPGGDHPKEATSELPTASLGATPPRALLAPTGNGAEDLGVAAIRP